MLVSKGVEEQWDYVLAGGGLQNTLIALAVLHHRPSARLLLLERDEVLCGNHTWSFHQSDVPLEIWRWLSPAISVQWQGYDVQFPGLERRVQSGYGSLSSRDLAAHTQEIISQSPHARIVTGAEITALADGQVRLADGRRFWGAHVIDGRGPATPPAGFRGGFQKFVGLELTLSSSGLRTTPLLMDATVPQEDGFRFFYVLPLAPDRVLIEDTCFSGNGALDITQGRAEVLAYAERNGYAVDSVTRCESGVLPMPYEMPRAWPRTMPLAVGYRGGFFHPATGYSFPVALRVAAHIAQYAPESPLNADWERLLNHHRNQYHFATILNRLLFTAYAPSERHYIFSRFYQLPEPRIERFYRMDSRLSDKARFFTGWPPRGFSLRGLLKGAATL